MLRRVAQAEVGLAAKHFLSRKMVFGIDRSLHHQTGRYLGRADRVVELRGAVCWCRLGHPLLDGVLLPILPLQIRRRFLEQRLALSLLLLEVSLRTRRLISALVARLQMALR